METLDFRDINIIKVADIMIKSKYGVYYFSKMLLVKEFGFFNIYFNEMSVLDEVKKEIEIETVEEYLEEKEGSLNLIFNKLYFNDYSIQKIDDVIATYKILDYWDSKNLLYSLIKFCNKFYISDYDRLIDAISSDCPHLNNSIISFINNHTELTDYVINKLAVIPHINRDIMFSIYTYHNNSLLKLIDLKRGPVKKEQVSYILELTNNKIDQHTKVIEQSQKDIKNIKDKSFDDIFNIFNNV